MSHASPSPQDHVAEGGVSSGEKEGKPKYCEVTLLEDSTVKDVPILNGHGVEYSTVTGTQNKHVCMIYHRYLCGRLVNWVEI